MVAKGIVLTDEATEVRLLAAMIVDPAVLARCDAIETDDFADLRHREVLAAIRELQLTCSSIDVASIADTIEMQDLKRDKHVADSVGVAFVGSLMFAKKFENDDLFCALVKWLQKLKARRAGL